MRKNIGLIVFQTSLFLMEVLFLYGLSINVTAFYSGVSGGWVALFTLMVMSGSIFMYLLLNVLCKNHKVDKDILRMSDLLKGLLLTGIGLLSDWRIGVCILLCNIVVYFIKKDTLNEVLKVIVWLLITIVSLYAYQNSWIEMSRCLLLVLSQFLLYEPFQKENIKEEKSNSKTIMLTTFISCFVICMLVSLFSQIEIAIIHIANEGELYRFSKCIIWFVGVGLLLVCSKVAKSYVENKVGSLLNKKETVISEHVIFVSLMIVCAIKLFPASHFLSIIMLLSCVSYLAFEYLMIVFAHIGKESFQVARWIMVHLMLCVIFISSQMLYDGINIDTSVVMMCAFMMIVIRMYMMQMHVYTIEITNDEEEVE